MILLLAACSPIQITIQPLASPLAPESSPTSAIAPDCESPDSPDERSTCIEAARIAALYFLDSGFYSKSGLINFLVISHTASEVATTAVNELTVDWAEEASQAVQQVRKVDKQVGRITPIDEVRGVLISLGFTSSEIEYAIQKSG